MVPGTTSPAPTTTMMTSQCLCQTSAMGIAHQTQDSGRSKKNKQKNKTTTTTNHGDDDDDDDDVEDNKQQEGTMFSSIDGSSTSSSSDEDDYTDTEGKTTEEQQQQHRGQTLCQHCVGRALRTAARVHQDTMSNWHQVRNECTNALRLESNTNDNDNDARVVGFNPTTANKGNNTSTLSGLEEESRRLRRRLEKLRRDCSETALKAYAKQVENEERRRDLTSRMERLKERRDVMNRLDSALLMKDSVVDDTAATSLTGGMMAEEIRTSQGQIRALRFRWACKAFEMHRLDVSVPPEDDYCAGGAASAASGGNNGGMRKQARGIGKIGGLPLPHTHELYGVLPAEELQSGLRLVGSLTSAVSRCLGIPVPHPILLRPGQDPAEDIADYGSRRERPSALGATPSPLLSTSGDAITTGGLTSSLSILAKQATWGLMGSSVEGEQQNDRGAGVVDPRQPTTASRPFLLNDDEDDIVIPPSMNPHLIQQRLHHATACVLAEHPPKTNNNSNGTGNSNGGGMDDNDLLSMSTSSLQSLMTNSSSSAQYALSAQVMNHDEFAIALQLLQNDVVTLCMRVGVPVGRLWPAEAMLLNLHALHKYSQEQANW